LFHVNRDSYYYIIWFIWLSYYIVSENSIIQYCEKKITGQIDVYEWLTYAVKKKRLMELVCFEWKNKRFEQSKNKWPIKIDTTSFVVIKQKREEKMNTRLLKPSCILKRRKKTKESLKIHRKDAFLLKRLWGNYKLIYY